MNQTTFEIPQMDCPSEENLIRLKLDPFHEVKHLDFDLENRRLSVFHQGDFVGIEKAILELNLGGRRISTQNIEEQEFQKDESQKKVLLAVLGINFAFFLIEIIAGWLAGSMGLVADSLDMLADSFVYGISLMAVGSSLTRKKKIARLAGYFQLTLAILGFGEVIRRFLGIEAIPDFGTMIGVSFFALIANGICLYLLHRSKSKEEVHMKASMIFTSNDVLINLGVILAGLLVWALDSKLPDLIIGALVFVLVLQGARRILKLGR